MKLPNCGGVLCQPEWADPSTIHSLAATAATAGFDAVWLHDHLVTPQELRDLGELRFYEPLTVMASLAQAHPTLTIGVATVVLPLRDPVLLAKQIATLDAFYPGRVIFGLGAGRYESEFQAVGLDLFSRRGKVSAEYLEIIRALRSQASVTYDGTFRSLADAVMYPKPLSGEGAPVWYAGNSRVAAVRAGRLADGWIGATLSANEVAGLITPMLRARQEAGLDPAAFSIALSATIQRDPAPGFEGRDSSHLHMHKSAITGDAQGVADALSAFVLVGVSHFLLSLRADSLEHLRDNMGWFASEVMPLVERPGGQLARVESTKRGGGQE